jgi:CBS-domain-containing membrane protein
MALPNRAGGPEVQKRPTSDILWGAAMCFVTFSVLGLVDASIKTRLGLPFMHGAWGTISMLAFGTIDNPVARRYNCVVATVASCAVVAACFQWFGAVWWSRALAVSTSLAFMMWTGSVHPPGAAAVMACMDISGFQELGLWYVAYPTLFGSLFILAMGKWCQRLKRRHEWTWGSPETPPPDEYCVVVAERPERGERERVGGGSLEGRWSAYDAEIEESLEAQPGGFCDDGRDD